MTDFLTFDVLVIGSGAAGFNAASSIKKLGKKSVALITEGINCGTSRNTGSDKQTYYKLGLGGDSPDSVRKMAADLFAGGSTDGDTALCEAALSARCFMRLCELGVEFPCNRYGEYIGYKTDHDPYARATSAGPLTSHYMTQALEKEARQLNVTIFDGLLAVEILKNKNEVCGLICLEINTGCLKVFRCTDIILATGGPAGIYSDSVYPDGHTGSTGLAIRAGASLQNMTEWQYGLASVSPKWNVSGTYMQCLPCFVSVDENGKEYEFLAEFFGDTYQALSMVFLKGYQWPFDCKKVLEGSSVIDLLVYRETVLRGRKVYLDFTKNPFGLNNIEFEKLSEEAYSYLSGAKACFGTPIERLLTMNSPAVELYRSKGVDITKQRLEIALCAQHNNGGIAVDIWWQSDVKGLFAVGECAGTHGVSRPGGSALNAGQVGSLRAAQYISAQDKSPISDGEFASISDKALSKHKDFCRNALSSPCNASEKLFSARKRMSDCCAAIRNKKEAGTLLEEVLDELKDFNSGASCEAEIVNVYKLKDTLLTQAAVLSAAIDFDGSRGSAIYSDENGELRKGLDEIFRFTFAKSSTYSQIQQIKYEDGQFKTSYRSVRPLPDDNEVFENVWRSYRENKNIY